MRQQDTQLSFKNETLYIGMDVHKKNWSIAIRSNGMEIRSASVEPSPEGLQNYLHRQFPEATYKSVYEAGFSGSWIHRRLVSLGIENIIVNPADVPTTDKQRKTKSDRIDSRKLAKQLEMKDLQAIWVLNEQQEALREMNRHRMVLVKDQTRQKNQIKSFLNRHGIALPKDSTCKHWSKRFLEYLRTVEFPQEMLQCSFKAKLDRLETDREHLKNHLKQMKLYIKQEGYQETVGLLMSTPGVGFITAVTLLSEIGDIERFKSSEALASFVGLVPIVKQSGESRVESGITKRQNSRLRKMLIESAWVSIRHDSSLLQYYNRQKREKSAQKAIVQVAKKLLNRIRYVWRHKTPYEYQRIQQ